MIDICRVRNPSSTRFTSRKNNFSGFIQRRLDYIFISNSVQESAQNINVLPSFCSLIHDEPYMLKIKKHIENIINLFDSDFNQQMKWEFLKCEIRKFTISFSKNKTKSVREKKLNLEKKLKLLKRKLNCNEAKDEYSVCKENLNVIYDEIANGIKIRSRCNWYEFGEKSNKFFLNLEKY